MKAFFDKLRELLGPFKQSQENGINVLLDATAGLSLPHRAYILATTWWETSRTMQPIYERGPKSYFEKYNAGTKIGKALGNTLSGDGYLFRGRGYVQLTGRRNYAKASAFCGVDLLAKPDKALEPAIAAKIIVSGMTQGWFTGKKLADYTDYVQMRRVVNGTDKATEIAGYATQFATALHTSQQSVSDGTDGIVWPIPYKPDVHETPVGASEWPLTDETPGSVKGFTMNMNFIRTVLTWLSIGVTAVSAIFGCTTTGDCSQSWLDPKYAGMLTVAMLFLNQIMKASQGGTFGTGLVNKTVPVVSAANVGVGTVTATQVASSK